MAASRQQRRGGVRSCEGSSRSSSSLSMTSCRLRAERRCPTGATPRRREHTTESAVCPVAHETPLWLVGGTGSEPANPRVRNQEWVATACHATSRNSVQGNTHGVRSALSYPRLQPNWQKLAELRRMPPEAPNTRTRRDVQASVGVGAKTPPMLDSFTGGTRKFGVCANSRADTVSRIGTCARRLRRSRSQKWLGFAHATIPKPRRERSTRWMALSTLT